MDLSEVEIQQLKEQNNRRVKRVVSVVALTLIIASIILVALSLSLGPKIDDLVVDPLDRKLTAEELFRNSMQDRNVSDEHNHHRGYRA